MFNLSAAIGRIAAKLVSVPATVLADTRKLDVGVHPVHRTLCLMREGGQPRLSSILDDSSIQESALRINGLLGRFAEGQIFVEGCYIPQIVPPSGGGYDPGYTRKEKMRLSATLSFIERSLGVHVLPVTCSGDVTFPTPTDGWQKGSKSGSPKMINRTFTKFLFIRKDGESYSERFATRWETTFGFTPNPKVVENNVKVLDYMVTATSGTFALDVAVIPSSWMQNPATLDGAAMHFPREGAENILFHHPRLNMDVRLGTVLHLRGLGYGSIYKGTTVPVTVSMCRAHIKPAHTKTVLGLLGKGWHVCTSDTYKYQAAGLYRGVEMHWHNDSNQVGFYNEVKLCFPQWAFRRMFTSFNGLVKLIGRRAKELGTAMVSVETLVKHLLQNREAFNDESVPGLAIVETLSQVLNGRPFGLSRSDAFSILKPMRMLMKGILEPVVGTRNIKGFNIDKHLGIAARAFVLCDPRLKSGEVGLPRFCYRAVADKMKGLDYHEECRRHPATVTSCIPVVSKMRDDNFAYITIPAEDAAGYGADYDGDQMEYLAVPNSLYRIRDLRQSELDKIKVPAGLDKFCVERPAIEAGIPAHHNAIFEVMASCIGVVHYSIEQVMHSLNKSHPWDEVLRAINVLECGPLTHIIDGKKHNLQSAVDLPHLVATVANLKVNYGMAYRAINGKLDFTGTKFRGELSNVEALESFPKKLKQMITKSRQVICYPAHMGWMRAILKYFPDTIGGVRLSDDRIQSDKVKLIVRQIFEENHELLRDRFYFSISNTARAWIYNPVLDALTGKILALSNDNSPTLQLWVRRATDRLWKSMISKCSTAEERATLELFLVGYAYNQRRNALGTPVHNQSMHGWIFSHVSAAALTEFIKMLKD